MELKICCDASVKLEKMSNVTNIYCDVVDFSIQKDTLKGNIKIYGKYIKDNLDENYDFDEMVPFTVVFKDKNFEVLDANVKNFTYQEVVNHGVECNFEVFVLYKKLVDDFNIEDDEVFEVYAGGLESVPQEMDMNEEVDEVSVENGAEALKVDINKKYDDLLQKILDSREDNFLDEKTDDITQAETIVSITKEEVIETKKFVSISPDNRSQSRVFDGIKENYGNVKVYYTKQESDIERICKSENVSIEKIYKDNQVSDYINKKRLIIK